MLKMFLSKGTAHSLSPLNLKCKRLLPPTGQCDQKKSPNVYKSYPKMISLEK